MLQLIVGVVAGGLISWVITHFYHVRSSRGQTALFAKLSDDVKTIILADRRETLTVPELNELLRSKTIDPQVSGTLPFKACPSCGSTELAFGDDLLDVESESDGAGGLAQHPIFVPSVNCKACGWSRNETDA